MIVAMPAQDEEDIDDPALAVRFTHPASGKSMEIATEDIPGEYAARLRVGEKLTVYADPRDAKRYWIDIKPSK